jgi:hypothetical protein
MRVAQLGVLGGAMARVPADATAFAHRARRIMVNVAALYQDCSESAYTMRGSPISPLNFSRVTALRTSTSVETRALRECAAPIQGVLGTGSLPSNAATTPATSSGSTTTSRRQWNGIECVRIRPSEALEETVRPSKARKPCALEAERFVSRLFP